MEGDRIRSTFINFFEEKGHQHMPSASLIPAGDPSLLFTSAGMVPFKPFFTGEQTPPSRRLTSSQKSFRTTDIDEVGDHKHLTFFEMLGNFSIGDYFKEGAVAFAWELATQRFELEPDRIFVTIHLDDDEAFGIWRDSVGIPVERIYRYGDKDNWWGPAGNEGATGPCSELHYDGGREKGCADMVTPDLLTALLKDERDGAPPQDVPGCHPNCDCERFVELWNLVFMQFYQDTGGSRTPLPAPSVDTGMGLERAAVVLQEKSNIYETDLFAPIIARVSELSGRAYGQDARTDFAMRVVAEHARAGAFLIGDGVVPGNEGRGYVLRRVLRRGIRYGRQMDLSGHFLAEVSGEAINRFQATYPELSENRDFILRVIGLEEERFADAFGRGSLILNGMFLARRRGSVGLAGDADGDAAPAGDEAAGEEMHAESIGAGIYAQALEELENSLPGGDEPQRCSENRREAARILQGSISGKEAFILYDTYGFPTELTAEIAREQGLEVDLEGFRREMEEARERSRAAHSFVGGMEVQAIYEDLRLDRTAFVGYQELSRETVVAAILAGRGDGSGVEAGPMESTGHAGQGQAVEIVLQETPFYAEGGGQQGDRGTITGPNGVVLVEDTQSPVAGLVVHRGVVQQGDVSLGEPVVAQVERQNRLDAARNHSSTHLLHAALRSVLGPHVRQAGSLVAPERLRFDFSHVSAMTFDELRSVQGLANEKIRENLAVSSTEASYSQAVGQGALAFFGDRYGEVVRVVSIGGETGGDTGGEAGEAGSGEQPFSREVCGGTHVAATGQVGTLFVLGESSIGGGMRRVEAISGRAAERLFLEQADRLAALSAKLQTPVGELETRLDSFIQDNEILKARLDAVERSALRAEAEQLLQRAADVDGVKVVAARTSAGSSDGMREMGDFLKARLNSAAIVLGAVIDGNPLLVAMLTRDLVDRGLHAGNLARDSAKVMGGRRRRTAGHGAGGRAPAGEAGAGAFRGGRVGAPGIGKLKLLALDLGERRIGLAVGETSIAQAWPAGHINRSGLKLDLGRVLDVAREREVQAILVGIPFTLSGEVGPQARRARGFAQRLRRATDLPVHEVDERFTFGGSRGDCCGRLDGSLPGIGRRWTKPRRR